MTKKVMILGLLFTFFLAGSLSAAQLEKAQVSPQTLKNTRTNPPAIKKPVIPSGTEMASTTNPEIVYFTWESINCGQWDKTHSFDVNIDNCNNCSINITQTNGEPPDIVSFATENMEIKAKFSSYENCLKHSYTPRKYSLTPSGSGYTGDGSHFYYLQLKTINDPISILTKECIFTSSAPDSTCKLEATGGSGKYNWRYKVETVNLIDKYEELEDNKLSFKQISGNTTVQVEACEKLITNSPSCVKSGPITVKNFEKLVIQPRINGYNILQDTSFPTPNGVSGCALSHCTEPLQVTYYQGTQMAGYTVPALNNSTLSLILLGGGTNCDTMTTWTISHPNANNVMKIEPYDGKTGDWSQPIVKFKTNDNKLTLDNVVITASCEGQSSNFTFDQIVYIKKPHIKIVGVTAGGKDLTNSEIKAINDSLGTKRIVIECSDSENTCNNKLTSNVTTDLETGDPFILSLKPDQTEVIYKPEDIDVMWNTNNNSYNFTPKLPYGKKTYDLDFRRVVCVDRIDGKSWHEMKKCPEASIPLARIRIIKN